MPSAAPWVGLDDAGLAALAARWRPSSGARCSSTGRYDRKRPLVDASTGTAARLGPSRLAVEARRLAGVLP